MKARKQCRFRLEGWTFVVRIGAVPAYDARGYCVADYDEKTATIDVWGGLTLPETLATLSHEVLHGVDAVFEESRAEAYELALLKAIRGLQLVEFTEDD